MSKKGQEEKDQSYLSWSEFISLWGCRKLSFGQYFIAYGIIFTLASAMGLVCLSLWRPEQITEPPHAWFLAFWALSVPFALHASWADKRRKEGEKHVYWATRFLRWVGWKKAPEPSTLSLLWRAVFFYPFWIIMSWPAFMVVLYCNQRLSAETAFSSLLSLMWDGVFFSCGMSVINGLLQKIQREI